MGTETIEPIPSEGKRGSWNNDKIDEQIDARMTRARAIAGKAADDITAEETRELGKLNDELQTLKSRWITPHPGFPKQSLRSAQWKKVDSVQYGRLDGLGESFLSEIRKQGGGELKALDATSGGATMPGSFFDPRLRDMPSRQLFVRSLIPSLNVNSDKVDYVRQTVATYAAAPVAAGSVKPSTLISAERVSAPVRVIATVSEAMDRSLLSDYDQLVDFINSQLRISVLQAEEDEIVSGSGSGIHLTGILNSGIQSQAKGSDPTPDAILKGMTKIRSYYREPDAVVFHPNDWQEIATLKTADGIYIWGSPANETEPRMWGKRVLTSPAVTEGTCLVGAFGEGATVYEREGIRISFSETGANDSGGDLFLTNTVRWRAESRIALAVQAPLAFAKVTGI